MAEFLIQALNETAAMRYWRGDPINCYPDGGIGTPIAPQYVAIRIPGLDVSELRTQCEEWWLRLAFTITASNLTTDSFTIKVEATEFNPTSGIGKLTAGKVETFLAGWGATGVTFSNAAVTFDVLILDAIKSPNFWRGHDLTGLILTETGYTQSTGIHTCRVNYKNSTLTAQQIKDAIAANGGTFISESTANKTVTFSVDRAAVREKLQNDVKMRAEKMIVRRKFHIAEATVAAIEAAGRDVTISVAEYNTYWRNKLAE